MNENTETAVAVIDAEPNNSALAVTQPKPVPSVPSATPQQLRVVEVNEALLPAYQKASTLDLTQGEVEKLCAPFPDDAVEIRPHDGLIYIPHIFISERLNQVFRPGQWALVCRRHWLDGNTMYGEYVMLIRGCFVGESVGGHPYQPNNPKTNYSDTLESTAAEALRRISGKRLSCGSQVWQPEYARQWIAKHGVKQENRWAKRPQASQSVPPARPPSAATPPVKAPPAKPQEAPKASQAHLERLIERLKPIRAGAEEYLRKAGILIPTETLEDLPLEKCPATKEAFVTLMAKIQAFMDGGGIGDDQIPGAEVPEQGEGEPAAHYDREDAPWRSFPMPFGKNSGMPLGILSKPYLFGLWNNYKVETEYNGRPKKPETIEKDTQFRAMLDEAGLHYGFQRKET